MITGIKQMQNSILKIKNADGRIGTGFYCLIELNNWNSFPLRVVMTNNHVLDENSIKIGDKIIYSLNNNKINKQIIIDESRITYTSKKYDITIIEIKEKDGINKDSFLEIDNKIFNNNPNEYFRDKPVYLLHYPKGYEIKRADGTIKYIDEKDNIQYYINSESGSSGGSIINLKNFKVIGIHKGAAKEGKNWNIGTLLKGPIEELKNIIKINKQIINNKKEENIEIDMKRKMEMNEDIKKDNAPNNKQTSKLINKEENIKDKKLEDICNDVPISKLKLSQEEIKIKEKEIEKKKEKEKENILLNLQIDNELENLEFNMQKKMNEYEHALKKIQLDYKDKIELRKKEIESNVLSFIGNKNEMKEIEISCLKFAQQKDILRINHDKNLWEINNNERISELNLKREEIKIEGIENEKEKEKLLIILKYDKELEEKNIYLKKEMEEFEYALELKKLEYNRKIEEKEIKKSNSLSFFKKKNI